MRICILSKHIPPRVTDGIAKNRWLYAKLFKENGWEVHLVTSGIGGMEDCRDGIFIHEVNEKDFDIQDQVINSLVNDESLRHVIAYSYAVYKRVDQLNKVFPIDIIDCGLWGIEGLVTKLKLPAIPMLTRFDTTSRLIDEINYPQKENGFTTLNKLEQYLILNSDLYCFNSWSILKETERLYEVSFKDKYYDVIHHGIDLVEGKTIIRNLKNEKKFKVLVPGRMEKRKGTHLMVKWILPELIRNKQIEIHFIGKDHADWDGFNNEMGVNYTQYIQRQFKSAINSQIFLHGHVDESTMQNMYEQADCILVPSLYESLGLVYLEAANYKKPIIAFRAGAIKELFIHNEEILLADPEKPLEISELVNKLYSNSELQIDIAEKCHEKLKQKYTSGKMIKRCLSFIKSYFDKPVDGKIYQMINSLTEGDGVGRIVLDYDYLIKQQGQITQIIGNHVSESLQKLSDQIHKFNFTEKDTLIYHYCGHCEWAHYFNSLHSPAKIFLFHNITPPHYFAENSNEFKSAANGYKQAPQLDGFDIYVTLSVYSENILKQLIPRKINTLVIPQLIDQQLINQRPFDAVLKKQLDQDTRLHIIFVGRVVPHKKQVDIIHFADYLRTNVNSNFRVTLIGGGTATYQKQLSDLIATLKLGKHVTLTGKIPDESLYAYYRSADIFLSMSEHEGFGIPLAEAMVFDMPVVAYGVTAIPETVGDNDCVFYEKNFSIIASIINRLSGDPAFKQQVINKQQLQLKKYNKESVQLALQKMYDLSHELHRQRVQTGKVKGNFFSEQFINFCNSQLKKTGTWNYADGRTLIHYGHEKESRLELTVPCDEVEVFMVHNNHSGKVAVYFNQDEAQIIDLFTPQWVIKGYSFKSKMGFNANILRIVPLCEKNRLSSGREVLIYGIRAKVKTNKPASSVFEKSMPLIQTAPV